MEHDQKSLTEMYYQQKLEGMSFSAIRKQLEELDLDPETITEIIKDIDNRIINDELTKTSGIKSRELKIIGLCIMVAGGLVTLATYFRLIEISGHYILAWGPIVSGYIMILASRRMKKRENKAGDRDYFGKR